MCVENSTVAPRPVLLEHEVAHQPLVDRVEAAERLVEDQQVGPVDHRGDELHLLLHPLRQVLAALVLGLAERHPLQPPRTCCWMPAPLHALEPRHVEEELADAHLLVEAALLGQVADPVLRLERRRPAEHGQVAAIRKEDRQDHPDHRRLARAVRADDAVQRPLGHLQVEVVDGDRLAERLSEVLQDNRIGHELSSESESEP